MRKITEIKDENDLLGFMIQNKDSNNDFNVNILRKKFGDNRLLDFEKMIQLLQEKNLVCLTSFDYVHIYQNGINSYISPLKKAWIFAKPVITHLLSAVLGAILSNFKEVLDFFVKMFSILNQ